MEAKRYSQQEVFDLIEQFTGKQAIIGLPSAFIKFTGDANSAILLNQIWYWSGKGIRKDGYIYKSYADWQEEIYLSERKVRTATQHLKNLGMVETAVYKANGNPTVHYRLTENAKSIFVSFLERNKKVSERNPCRNDTADMSETKVTKPQEPYTESTPEITLSKPSRTSVQPPNGAGEKLRNTSLPGDVPINKEPIFDEKGNPVTPPLKTEAGIVYKVNRLSGQLKKTDPRVLETLYKAVSFMRSDCHFPEGKDPFSGWGIEGTGVKRMLKRGFTPDEILDCWKAWVLSNNKDYVSMVWINTKIGKTLPTNTNGWSRAR